MAVVGCQGASLTKPRRGKERREGVRVGESSCWVEASAGWEANEHLRQIASGQSEVTTYRET